MKRVLTKSTPKHTGEKVTLKGWVQNRREHGNVYFLDLKDFSGIAQVVFSEDIDEDAYKEAQDLGSQWVVKIEGKVEERPEGMENERLKSGSIEVKATDLKVINESKPPSFDIKRDGYEVSEELRLEKRYLDLRRPRLQKNLRLRQKVKDKVRDFMKEKEFIEIETPVLTKSTPEGARDFIVPSRLQEGEFYALPQSPQQYKQLLMIAGFERYFQFPHVFRDEDLRADRLFEHTQLDIEMSFTSEDFIRSMVEELAIKITEDVLGKRVKEKPFPVISYDEAMEKYECDDPDLRSDEEKEKDDLMSYAWVVDFPMFEKKEDGSLGASHHPFTRVKEDDLDKLDRTLEAKNKSELATQIQARQYDLVLNGHEVFGGSIREHRPEILKKVFEVLGHTDEEIEEKFGHLMEAFQYAVPPHGGIAAGFDRWLATLLGEKSIREVVAFPTTSSGKTSVMDAPSKVDPEQLRELGIEVVED